MRPTVVLSMIVRNEAHVVRRCLDSVRDLIDTWVIVDTGSTDGTQDVIREYFAAQRLPGQLYERDWQDFAANRSEALDLARDWADYTLLIDADDTLETLLGFAWPDLTAECYRFNFADGNITYQRPCLVRNALPWRYQGVLHEFLTGGNGDGPMMPGAVIRRHHEGARSRDPEKFRKDAAVFEAALATEADPLLVQRYWFYLAQSWRDCGEREKAVAAYLERAERGGWAEEVCVSLYTAARLKQALGHPEQEVLDLFGRAFLAAPMRAEGLHGAAQVSRAAGRFVEGYHFAKVAMALPQPANRLFVEPWVYSFGLPDELAVNGDLAGYHLDSLIASATVLIEGRCPPHEVARVTENAGHALRRICERARANARSV